MSHFRFAATMLGCASIAVACDNSDSSFSCDGFEISAVPEGATHRELNGDDRIDSYFSDYGVGSAVFIDCGEGKSAKVVSGTASIIPEPSSQPGAWGDIMIAESNSGFLQVGNDRYRVSTLPFQSGAPDDLRLVHDGERYRIDLPRCEALNLNAPVYVIPDPSIGSNGSPKVMTAKFGDGPVGINLGDQESYFIDRLQKVSINDDDVGDVLIEYRDRSGSGRAAHVAVMLGCGGGDYTLSGMIELGHADGGAMIEPFDRGLLTINNEGNRAGYRVDPETFDLRLAGRGPEDEPKKIGND